mmetsp:Transcript_12560/g.26498  ORF Transcript_12560/g.26498 Transcript_12560/m.26498 type:complete len:351 (-) Transcript_12560:526-1578(-)
MLSPFRSNHSVVCLNTICINVHVKILSSHPLVQAEKVINVPFKVGSCIKARRDVAFVSTSITNRLISCCNHGKSLGNIAKKSQTGGHFFVGISTLHLSRNNGNINSLRGNIVQSGNGAHENIIGAVHLRTRDDDLDTLHISAVWDGMIQKADASNNLASCPDLLFGKVRRIADNKLSPSHFISTLHPHGFSFVIVDDFIDITIEHEGTSVNGAKTRKTFRESSKAIDRVDVRASSISRQGVAVSLEFLHRWQCGLIKMVVVQLQTHRVGYELVGISDKPEGVVELPHGHFGQVLPLVSIRFGFIVGINIKKETAETTFFKKSHERRFKCLLRSRRDLEHFPPFVDERSLD